MKPTPYKGIKVFTPIKDTAIYREILYQEIKIVKSYLSYPLSIQPVFLRFGPTQIISEDDELAANEAINKMIYDLRHDDNILLNCTADIGLDIIRQKVRHVVGIGSEGFKKALEMGSIFSIIVPNEDYISGIKSQIKKMGIDENVLGILSLNSNVDEFLYEKDLVVDKTIHVIEDNNVDDLGPILFGCGTMLLFYNDLRNERFFQNIVEPTIAGMLELEQKIVKDCCF